MSDALRSIDRTGASPSCKRWDEIESSGITAAEAHALIRRMFATRRMRPVLIPAPLYNALRRRRQGQLLAAALWPP